jgi:hypothetical protein
VFAAVGWGLGPHWAVPGFCVLAATLVALVAVERDGLAPPLSVAVIGTAIAGAFLVAAGAADRRWTHVVGLAIGLGVATILVIVNRRFGDRPTDDVPWTAVAPVLLPVGAALGWLGPAYAGAGLATIVVLLLAVGIVRPSRGSGLLGAALAAGAVVATVLAVALGTGVGT